jgi:hypothetical protein
MKSYFGALLLIALIACNQNTPQQGTRPPLNTSDSNVVKNSAANPYVPVDISPMDMSYLPIDYPKMSERVHPPIARVIYSRPHKQGRAIFGNLLKYGEPWRLGANEATEIELFQPVTVQSKTIPKGRYVLYCIPEADHWTIIFNSNLNSWGLTPDLSKDLYRFDIPVLQKDQSVEFFSMVFQKDTGTTADLVMAWDNVEARLPLQYTQP